MNHRVTITVDNAIESKIKAIQAKKISETNTNVSLSGVINDVLKQGLKEFRWIVPLFH